MNRMRKSMALAILAVFILIPAQAFAQSHNSSRARTRTYKPQVKAYSESLIIEGSICGIEPGRLIVKTRRGSRVQLEMDDNTTMLESGELVSIATMGDIALTLSDLKTADSVEIVVEHARNRQIARIITRIANSDAPVARR